MDDAFGRIAALARPRRLLRPGRRRCQGEQRRAGARRRRRPARRRQRHLRGTGARRGVRPARPARRVSLDRALELAEAVRGRAYPKPTVGAVVVRDGEIVGEGATEAAGRHGEVVALEHAGERAHGATLYVTMEPCAHHGTTPPCVDAILAAGIARVVAGSRDPNPEAAGGLERLERERRRDRARRPPRGSAPERGVAHVGRRAPAVRRLQGRCDARRQGDGARLSLGLRRGLAPARARAARRRRRRRGRDGHRAAREPAARRARRAGRRASRGASPSEPGRCPRDPSSSCAQGRSTRSCTRSGRTESSRSCSKAARRSPAPSCAPASSTRCSSSSPRSCLDRVRACSTASTSRCGSSTRPAGGSATTSSIEGYLREP